MAKHKKCYFLNLYNYNYYLFLFCFFHTLAIGPFLTLMMYFSLMETKVLCKGQYCSNR